jgi:hypothetical protein
MIFKVVDATAVLSIKAAHANEHNITNDLDDVRQFEVKSGGGRS